MLFLKDIVLEILRDHQHTHGDGSPSASDLCHVGGAHEYSSEADCDRLLLFQDKVHSGHTSGQLHQLTLFFAV